MASIQSAIDDAWEGATIWVCPGLYNETVKVNKPAPAKAGSSGAGTPAVQARKRACGSAAGAPGR